MRLGTVRGQFLRPGSRTGRPSHREHIDGEERGAREGVGRNRAPQSPRADTGSAATTSATVFGTEHVRRGSRRLKLSNHPPDPFVMRLSQLDGSLRVDRRPDAGRGSRRRS